MIFHSTFLSCICSNVYPVVGTIVVCSALEVVYESEGEIFVKLEVTQIVVVVFLRSVVVESP